MKKRKIALCGSMKVKDQIIALGEEITKRDFEALLPEECIAGKPKNEASRAHFKRIIEQADAILVVNATAHDTENYIGPNSFAEIAIAFYYNKPVFLWHDIYGINHNKFTLFDHAFNLRYKSLQDVIRRFPERHQTLIIN